MGKLEDAFEPLVAELATADAAQPPAPAALPVLTARLHGFDLDERPLVAELPALPGEIVTARSTIALARSQVGAAVVIVLDAGDPHRPIILGVIQPAAAPATPPQPQVVEADGERQLISAEREIVLRCGDASITLTRAGKVIIRGNYILSRSRGLNKLKGAAIELN